MLNTVESKENKISLAFFTLETVEAMIHAPLEKMLLVCVERIKEFFLTEYVCIHFYPLLGLAPDIAKNGLLSCPLAKVPPPTQEKLLEVENRLNLLAMSKAEIIDHKDIFDKIEGWQELISYFNFKEGVTIPLIYQDEVFGVIDIYHKSPLPFTALDLKVLETLGSCLYGAVKKEILIRELRDRDDLIEAFAKTIEAADKYTGGHVDRVKVYAVRLGKEVGLDGDELKALKRAALLHDVGKIGVSESILNKPGPLTAEERKIIEKHPLIGEKIFTSLQDGNLKKALDGILYHHERIDGMGYPHGLKGEEIPLIARIIAIADTFDALTSDRPYRKGMDVHKALSILKEAKQTQLDAELVDTFINKELYLNPERG